MRLNIESTHPWPGPMPARLTDIKYEVRRDTYRLWAEQYGIDADNGISYAEMLHEKHGKEGEQLAKQLGFADLRDALASLADYEAQMMYDALEQYTERLNAWNDAMRAARRNPW